MTKYQENKINSIETLILFCDQNEAIAESLPEFNQNLDDLKETIAEIKMVGEKQKTGLTGIAVDKNSFATD